MLVLRSTKAKPPGRDMHGYFHRWPFKYSSLGQVATLTPSLKGSSTPVMSPELSSRSGTLDKSFMNSGFRSRG